MVLQTVIIESIKDMGITDILSGKTYRYNALIGRNVNKIINQVKDLPDPNFIKDWVSACVLDIDKTLETVFFREIKGKKGEKGIFNDLKNNIVLFDEQKIFYIFKLMCGFHLFAFLKNKSFARFLEEVGLNKENFEKQVFDIFDFTQDDKTLYRKLAQAYDDRASDYPLGVWDEIVKNCFGDTHDVSPATGIALSLLMWNNYNEIFYLALSNILKPGT